MKTRITLTLAAILVMLVAAVPLNGSVASVLSQPKAMAPAQGEPPIPDLSSLLNYPHQATIVEYAVGTPERAAVITKLMGRPETLDLIAAMAAKGFVFDPVYVQDHAVVMHVVIPTTASPVEVDALTVKVLDPARGLSAALTAMQPMDPGSKGFYQAHHTNLDPNLAEVPDPPIVFNGMPYFYITTLRWIGGPVPILYWHYWWFDSHHHPNWYYAHYYWYWRYYGWYLVDWPYWYWWVHGWYYWRYWYFWSTYFPW